MANSFTKLKSGNWGIRVEGQRPTDGARVEVEKKDGARNTVTVERVVWSAEDGKLHLCAIVDERKQNAAPRSRFYRRDDYCHDCGGGGSKYGGAPCPTCGDEL